MIKIASVDARLATYEPKINCLAKRHADEPQEESLVLTVYSQI